MASWYALPTPIVPIVPALLVGVLYALLTTTRPGAYGERGGAVWIRTSA